MTVATLISNTITDRLISQGFDQQIIEAVKNGNWNFYRKAVGVPPVQEWSPRLSLENHGPLNIAQALVAEYMKRPNSPDYILSEESDEILWDVFRKVFHPGHKFWNLYTRTVNGIEPDFFDDLTTPLEKTVFKRYPGVFLCIDAVFLSGEGLDESEHRLMLKCSLHYLVAHLIFSQCYRNTIATLSKWSRIMVSHFPEIGHEGLSHEEKLSMIYNSGRMSLQRALDSSLYLPVPFLQKRIMELIQQTEKETRW